jgi:hypothetical protein
MMREQLAEKGVYESRVLRTKINIVTAVEAHISFRFGSPGKLKPPESRDRFVVADLTRYSISRRVARDLLVAGSS